MAVTIKDIARRAGVAHTTVSRALLGNSLISPATAARIRGIAAEMGYRPSAAARSLKTNRSEVLGVILSNIDDPYFSEVLQGIEDTARQSGYSLFIAASHRDPERERSIVQAMVEHRVEGVIICSSAFGADRARDLAQYHVPMVAVNNQAAEDYHYSIYHDDPAGSRQVTEHLIQLGHRRIGYLGNASAGRTNQERLRGYEEALKLARLDVLAQNVLCPEAGTRGEIEKNLRGCLQAEGRPTALVCFNDMMAIEAMAAVRRMGLRIPDDLSVTGFDNIYFSAFTQPPLTTFDQPKRFIGEEAARLLLNLLRKDATEETVEQNVRVLRGRLLVRESTAGPRSRA